MRELEQLLDRLSEGRASPTDARRCAAFAQARPLLETYVLSARQRDVAHGWRHCEQRLSERVEHRAIVALEATP